MRRILTSEIVVPSNPKESLSVCTRLEKIFENYRDIQEHGKELDSIIDSFGDQINQAKLCVEDYTMYVWIQFNLAHRELWKVRDEIETRFNRMVVGTGMGPESLNVKWRSLEVTIEGTKLDTIRHMYERKKKEGVRG